MNTYTDLHPTSGALPDSSRSGAVVIPVIEETIRIDKRVEEGGGFRVIKSVVTEQKTIEEPTFHESATVDRVAVDRVLDRGEDLPKPRREGDLLVIPIFEEILVTEKRTRITEEIHILLARTETVSAQTETIRREVVTIEPLAPKDDSLSTRD